MNDGATNTGALAWLLDHLWAPALGLIGVVWRQNEQAHKDTRKVAEDALAAHKADDEEAHNAFKDELRTQRGHIGKLFDQMRDESNRSEARHRELMEHMHNTHSGLLTALHTGLAGKADK